MAGINLQRVLIVSRGLIHYKNKFLFIRRAPSDTYAPNKWELPGGKLDEDETLEENLLRECKEEIGLGLKILRHDLLVTCEVSKSGKYNGLPVITVAGLLNAKKDLVKLSTEHSEYKWLNLGEAKSLRLTESCRLVIKRINSDPYLSALVSKPKTLSRPSK